MIGGAIHLALVALVWAVPHLAQNDVWLALDSLGKIVLAVISVCFFRLRRCTRWAIPRSKEESRSSACSAPACLGFLASSTLIALSHHVGLMWVALESTTLVSAPLIYFKRDALSLEATWKYLLLGSVGVALALLGSFFLAYAALHAGLHHISFAFEDLMQSAPRLSKPWLHSAFVLLFIGYGTKMGLAPMHTWKPDAYGEAPGLVGSLLAGITTSCTFVAILRFHRILMAAGDGSFARRIMVIFGLGSIAVAAVFMVRQGDLKRALAYSSVEHVGILVLGVGIGGLGVVGALLHMINNALAKGVLFLSAGNIHRAYQSKSTRDVSGALERVPYSGVLLLAGFLAITGSPPFGPFRSELTIVRAAFDGVQVFTGALMHVLLIRRCSWGSVERCSSVVQGAIHRPCRRPPRTAIVA